MKLKQKQFLKGSRVYEIEGETLFVRLKSLLRQSTMTVDISTLDPEPVVDGEELAFYSNYKGRPVFTMLVDKPDAEAFNAFVSALKQIASNQEETAESDEDSPEAAKAAALARNVYEEPPEFAGPEEARENLEYEPVNTERLANDINMLTSYLEGDDIKTLVDTLEALKAAPESEAAFRSMLEVFDGLGIRTGAVLTYAPYLKALLSKYNLS